MFKIFDNKFLSKIVVDAKNDVVEGKDFIVLSKMKESCQIYLFN
jgi:hypothetical protein